jgi:polysaccharide export outer membrane protein
MSLIKLVVMMLIVCFTNVSYASDNDTYKLKQGDAVLISVYGEEALNKELRVLPDGSITFPLAGRISVVNLTSQEVEIKVTEKLKEFLPEPQVTVIVSSVEGNKVYLVGKVLKPGPILLTGPMNVLQALSLSGGFDKFAHTNNIKVLRASNNSATSNSTVALPVKYESLLNGEELSSNIQLQAGDIIVVP